MNESQAQIQTKDVAQLIHAIRNPLAGIRATAESVAEEGEDAGLGYALELIIEEVDRLEAILKQYGMLVRHRTPRRRPVSVKEVVETARSACVSAGRVEGRELSVEIRSDGEVWVDREKLEKVLTNLIDNAADATPVGGTITVRAEISGGDLVLEVQDTGCGIPNRHMGRVLDAFFTTRSERIGLGLAVCSRLIEDHGGRLDITSEVGRGTTVRVTLKASEPA